MKYCAYCGQILNDTDLFCGRCGSSADTRIYNQQYVEANEYAQEQDVLATYYKLIKWERLAWKIDMIYCLVTTIFIAVILSAIVLLFIFARGIQDPDAIVFLSFYSTTFIHFLPVFIITRIMYIKRNTLMNTVYEDLETAYKVYNNPGCIVLSVLFGNVACVFAIINFAITKSKKKIIHRIIYKQTGKVRTEVEE